MADYISDSQNKLSKKDNNNIQSQTIGTKNAQSGIGDSSRREAFPPRINSVSEDVWQGNSNSHIVLGKDRNEAISDGYGGKGYSESGMVHIVAGHYGGGIGLYSEDPENPVKSDPNFMLDSSYIYLSQRADIDDYLMLKEGKVGNSIDKSAIALKADDIRIIGERGIKLVTSRFSEDSRRKSIIKASGIDLIAGNDDKDLQPMLKGNNTSEAFEKLTLIINSVIELISNIAHYQMYANAEIATHQHITNVPGDPTLPESATLLNTCNSTNQNFSDHTFTECLNVMQDLALFRSKYLGVDGESCIRSKYNNTN